MSTLNIKSFPDDLYERLRKKADQERRSVAQQVIRLLEHALSETPSRSILELRGLGKGCWTAAEPTEHVAHERDSWDS